MNKFMIKFRKMLSEDFCRSSFRSDPLGNRVEIPYGGTYKVGKNGRGKGIRKGNTAKEDKTGQVHDVPPGHVLKIGSNGKGVVVCPDESTSEKKGQIVVNRKKTKNGLVSRICGEKVALEASQVHDTERV